MYRYSCFTPLPSQQIFVYGCVNGCDSVWMYKWVYVTVYVIVWIYVWRYTCACVYESVWLWLLMSLNVCLCVHVTGGEFFYWNLKALPLDLWPPLQRNLQNHRETRTALSNDTVPLYCSGHITNIVLWASTFETRSTIFFWYYNYHTLSIIQG